ncbi:hypothetical protein [Streptomyces sp. Ru72]|uniref:hypothetical protein n=1 Tax=Streptomyces sp. Ru72 TaxID=2080747 RepID=UPI000CDDC0F9|nr:hypothetical protein [Streptomyces sp. Ru72]POX42805.1 hypothetical protein C3488_36525 [Streptomyces sp. Ru72]
MTHGANAAPDPNPRADAASAHGCEVCNGWGSVITHWGRHELCSTCQPHADREDHDTSTASQATWQRRNGRW